jgi:hypothetical protein
MFVAENVETRMKVKNYMGKSIEKVERRRRMNKNIRFVDLKFIPTKSM